MEYILKSCLIIVLFIVFWQDFKYRLVYWFLYLAIAILGFAIQFKQTELYYLALSICTNLILIGAVLIVLFLYAKFYLKKNLINEALGIGDIFMFIAMAFTFPLETFIYVFSIGHFFSLLLHILISKINKHHHTIPLAGYLALCMTLFFILDLHTTLN